MKYNSNNPPIVCMQTNSTCYKQTRIMTPIGILVHSTGANNPNLKRYVQPLSSNANYNNLLNLIGKNTNGNDYNHMEYQSGLNAWIGKLADGTVTSIQTMPWNYRPWGCGSGSKGSCNNGWIQFEICEDSLTDPIYFQEVYKEACELMAYLCKLYNLNPKGYTTNNGVKTPIILCHQDSYKLGLGSNHSDVYNWFNKYGKTMEDMRNDILAIMNYQNVSIPEVKEEEEVTQQQFNEMMNTWLTEQATLQPADWSAEARSWAESNGFIQGDDTGNKMYKKPITREEFITVLYRVINNPTGQPQDYSREAREWAEKNGIIQGDGSGNKMYEKMPTREELITILYRALKK